MLLLLLLLVRAQVGGGRGVELEVREIILHVLRDFGHDPKMGNC